MAGSPDAGIGRLEAVGAFARRAHLAIDSESVLEEARRVLAEALDVERVDLLRPGGAATSTDTQATDTQAEVRSDETVWGTFALRLRSPGRLLDAEDVAFVDAIVAIAAASASGAARGASRARLAADGESEHVSSLQRRNRELQDFAAVASHDLQEPLRKVEAFSERLRAHLGGALDDEGHDYLDRMHRSIGRMKTLITDLLLYARVSTSARGLEPVDLGATVRAACSDLDVRLAETAGRIEVDDLPTIEADPTQMRQLFQNLLANGLKFHRDGVPPVIEVRLDSSAPDCVCVRVQDDGIGFEERHLDRLFAPFGRLHGRDKYDGTGIGLAICRAIVERHAGSITARSTPGTGSTFLVTLPRRAPEAP